MRIYNIYIYVKTFEIYLEKKLMLIFSYNIITHHKIIK
jgi:hypothetical protein